MGYIYIIYKYIILLYNTHIYICIIIYYIYRPTSFDCFVFHEMMGT
jgi:hypothetical protein